MLRSEAAVGGAIRLSTVTVRDPRGPPRGAGVGSRLRPTVAHRWLPRIPDGLADPLWALGAARAPPRQRPHAEAALEAATPTAVCPGGQDGAPAALGAGEPSGGVWPPGGRQCRVGSPWLPDQYRFHRAAEPHHPAACGSGGTAGQHAV